MNEHYSINDDMPVSRDQERMRRDLRYYFMNPKEKWQAKGTIPFKLVIIVIKVILMTFQLIQFSEYSVNEVTFFDGSETTFKHLFLKNWDWSLETPSYPPSHGPYALYRIDDFYDSITYTLQNYYNLTLEAIGPYGYGDKPQASFCVWHYNISDIYTNNSTYRYSEKIVKQCADLIPLNDTVNMYDSRKILQQNGIDINFNGLLEAEVTLIARSIQLKSFELNRVPNCYEFTILIKYNNNNHNGQLTVNLHSSPTSLKCHPEYNVSLKESKEYMSLVLDIFCLIFSILSFLLILRSSISQYRFWRSVKEFFLKERKLDVSDKIWYFFKYAYLIILNGDSCTIIGTCIRITFYSFIHDQVTKSHNADFIACSYFLGIGLFCAYLSILRYLSYYRKSSLLMLTLKYSANTLIRFSLCSFILYMAFSLFGWIILGPYHIKFRSLSSTIACLFSLMNGDDMYTTLSIVNPKNDFIYVCSQIFIYIFVALFIFVVLNLVLTIIIEGYDEVKQGNDIATSKTDPFWNFVNSCPATAKSSEYRHDKMYDKSVSDQRKRYFYNKVVNYLCCCISGSHGRELDIHQDPSDLNQYHHHNHHCDDDCDNFQEMHSDFHHSNSDYFDEQIPPYRSVNIRNRFNSDMPEINVAAPYPTMVFRPRYRQRRRFGKRPSHLTNHMGYLVKKNGRLYYTHTHRHTHEVDESDVISQTPVLPSTSTRYRTLCANRYSGDQVPNNYGSLATTTPIQIRASNFDIREEGGSNNDSFIVDDENNLIVRDERVRSL